MNRRATDHILIEMSGTIGKMSGTIEAIHEKVDKIDEKFEHHEDRIGILENDKAKALGAAFGISAIISAVGLAVNWVIK